MTEYVGFFKQERITSANAKDAILPKYGFHYGIDCPGCGRWQRWLKQTDEICGQKFYLLENKS